MESYVQVCRHHPCRDLAVSAPRGGNHAVSGQLSHANGSDERHQALLHVPEVGGKGRPWCCCMASALQVICGPPWQRIVLAKDHTVIVPDLRGMGLSDHPDTGYTKKNQAVDIAGVMDALKVQKADLVTHDIGNMVGYALAAQYPGSGSHAGWW